MAGRQRVAERALVAAVAAATAVAGAAGLRAATSPPNAQAPLRALADHARRRIGSAVDTAALAAEPDYAGLLAREFSSVTAENAMKWERVEPARGRSDYRAADRLVAFARAHHMTVRGHTLVWHSQLPAWLTRGSFGKAALAAILRRHVVGEVSHFRGRVQAWDVVNEPLADDGSLRRTIWYGALGPGYVAQALRWAHRADPKAELYLNDYGIEGPGPKADAMLALAKSLLARHVPLDGIGFESHLDVRSGVPSGMAQTMRRFAALGLDVAITEADVRVPLPATAAELAQQAADYGRLARTCLAIERCVSFTVWGFTDRHSWIPGFFAGEGAADLFDRNLDPKPAYAAVHAAFAGAART